HITQYLAIAALALSSTSIQFTRTQDVGYYTSSVAQTCLNIVSRVTIRVLDLAISPAYNSTTWVPPR
ncbi:hypothetical protein ACXWSM_09325, partial [Streptococcus pyogenes]